MFVIIAASYSIVYAETDSSLLLESVNVVDSADECETESDDSELFSTPTHVNAFIRSYISYNQFKLSVHNSYKHVNQAIRAPPSFYL